jgi:RHS repeat-associated protein
MSNCLAGFNGERLDVVSGTTSLGNGYRVYNPVLRRFNFPDSWSPFGYGDINPYVYCAGDPVNHSDPTGHLSWQAWLGIGMGIAGLGLAILTAGASIAATGGIIAAIESASAVSLEIGAAGVASDVTAIASGATEESNPEVSSVLSWVSLGTGAVGLAYGLCSAGSAGYRVVKNLLRNETDVPGEWVSAGKCLSTQRNTRAEHILTEYVNQLAAPANFTLPSDIFPLGLTRDGGGLEFMSTARGAMTEEGPTLDVFGHGGIENDSGVFNLNGRNLNAAQLNAYLSGNVDNYDRYSRLRLITCYSANGGRNSLAAQLSRVSGKRVMGFRDVVERRYVSGRSGGVIDGGIASGGAVGRYHESGGNLAEIRQFLNNRAVPLNPILKLIGASVLF